MLSSPNQSGPIPRSKEIDALRGIAIILVLGRHLLHIPDGLSPILATLFAIWARIGWIGVDLFFVLSGFLVAGLLFAEQQRSGSMRIGRFLIRRAFKIYPAFYFFLFFSFLMSATLAVPSPVTFKHYAAEALFVQNYFDPVWNHTWSLAVEEHFYLLLALLIAVMRWRAKGNGNPFRQLPLIVGVVGSLILALRVTRAYSLPGDANTLPLNAYVLPGDSNSLPLNAWQTLAFPSHYRIDSLFFGVLLAYFFHFHRGELSRQAERFRTLFLVVASFAFALPPFCRLEHSRFIHSFGYTLLYFAFGAIVILSLLSRFKQNALLLKALALPTQIGERSYSIYLWHMMVYHLTFRICPPATPAAFYMQTLLYLAGSVLVGSATAKLVEFPMLIIRDRYFPSSQRQVDIPR